MSEKLKQCPFCKGEFAFDFEAKNFRCGTCGATVPPDPYARTVNTRPIEDALNARIAELEAAQRWIPVSERLPDTKILYDKFDVIVGLVDIGNGEMIRRVDLLFYDYRNKSWNDDCGEFGFYPVTGITHWRERPTPPEYPNDTQTQTFVYGKEDSEVGE